MDGKALPDYVMVALVTSRWLTGAICYKPMLSHQLTPVMHGGSNHVQTCATAKEPGANYMCISLQQLFCSHHGQGLCDETNVCLYSGHLEMHPDLQASKTQPQLYLLSPKLM